jgi:hypothetical protein
MLLSQLLMMLRRELPPSLVQPCTIGWLMETPSPVAVTTRLLDMRAKSRDSPDRRAVQVGN